MKVLLLAALVSQVVGKPQQGYYQPGNTWSDPAQPTQWKPSEHQHQHQHQQPGNTWINPAQPTRWSAWSGVEVGAPSSYNSYDSYNSYNPYNPYIPNNPYNPVNPYNPHNPYDYDVPGSGGDVNSVSGSVGGPFIQDIGLEQQGFLVSITTSSKCSQMREGRGQLVKISLTKLVCQGGIPSPLEL